MSTEVLSRTIDVVRRSGLIGEHLSVVWHAGEPLVLPRDYYETAIETFAVRCRGVSVSHSIQTNASLINAAWCDFFKTYHIRLGVSVDGPAEVHDKHRRDRLGHGTHAKVMAGITALREHDVPFHVIAVVTADSLDYPKRIMEFFTDIGVQCVGFNFEELEVANKQSTLKPIADSTNRIREFFEEVFRINSSLERPLQIREFTRAHNALVAQGSGPALGNNQTRPFGIVSVDCFGNVSTFSPELLGATHERYGNFQFGNVMTGDLIDLLANQHFLTTAREIAEGVKSCADRCEYFPYCGGGAPSNKLYENGTFASTETMYCRNSIQMPLEIVLKHLEKAAEVQEKT